MIYCSHTGSANKEKMTVASGHNVYIVVAWAWHVLGGGRIAEAVGT